MAFLLWFGVSLGCMAAADAVQRRRRPLGRRHPPDPRNRRARGLSDGPPLHPDPALGLTLDLSLDDPAGSAQAVQRRTINTTSGSSPDCLLRPERFFTGSSGGSRAVHEPPPAPRPGTAGVHPHRGHGDRGRDVPTRDHNPGGTEAPSGAGSWLKTISAPGSWSTASPSRLAAIDWAMSLQPGWYSTIYGLLFIVSQGLGALAFCTVVADGPERMVRAVQGGIRAAGRLHDRRRTSRDRADGSPDDFNDLGNLMLTFTILWAYMSFSQFLIQWAGNLPEETAYYRVRTCMAGAFLGLVLIALHFFLPFFCLLSRDMKRKAAPGHAGGLHPGHAAAGLVLVRLPQRPPRHDDRLVAGCGRFRGADRRNRPVCLRFSAWQLAGRAEGGMSLLPPPGYDPHAGHATPSRFRGAVPRDCGAQHVGRHASWVTIQSEFYQGRARQGRK